MLYHLDDIRQFLDKFGSITNDITILDHRFLDMELFKPLFCAIALIGIHIGRPFSSLLFDTETNYDTLLDAFPKLHQNLMDTEISKYLQFESVVCDFVSQYRFKKLLPKSFADDETNKVLKISSLESSKCCKLNQALVHNLNEERSVD